MCLVHFSLGSTKGYLKGYPPPDGAVRNFLTASDIKADEALCLVQHFLLALFKKTAETIKGMGKDKVSRVRKFREFMSDGQSMSSVGPGRCKFYADVLKDACHVSCGVLFLSTFSYRYLQRRIPTTLLLVTSEYQKHYKIFKKLSMPIAIQAPAASSLQNHQANS